MDAALIAGVALMGLAGTPHCAAMCGAPCAAVTRGRGADVAAWQAGRMAGYAVAGAIAAGSVGVLAALGPAMPALRSVWVLAHAGALALGLWLLVMGRWPAWLAWHFAPPTAADAAPSGGAAAAGAGGAAVVRIVPRRAATRMAGAGALWALMPCGLLQSALLVAALANSPWSAAAAMGAFAATSAAGPVLAPLVLGRWGGLQGRALAGPTRAAGAMLVLASGWALGHGVWEQVQAWCA